MLVYGSVVKLENQLNYILSLENVIIKDTIVATILSNSYICIVFILSTYLPHTVPTLKSTYTEHLLIYLLKVNIFVEYRRKRKTFIERNIS